MPTASIARLGLRAETRILAIGVFGWGKVVVRFVATLFMITPGWVGLERCIPSAHHGSSVYIYSFKLALARLMLFARVMRNIRRRNLMCVFRVQIDVCFLFLFMS